MPTRSCDGCSCVRGCQRQGVVLRVGTGMERIGDRTGSATCILSFTLFPLWPLWPCLRWPTWDGTCIQGMAWPTWLAHGLCGDPLLWPLPFTSPSSSFAFCWLRGWWVPPLLLFCALGGLGMPWVGRYELLNFCSCILFHALAPPARACPHFSSFCFCGWLAKELVLWPPTFRLPTSCSLGVLCLPVAVVNSWWLSMM